MTDSRRRFLKNISLGSGTALLTPMLDRFALAADGVAREKLPQRFVFVVKSSGIIPDRFEPKTLKPKIADKSRFVNESLKSHKLPTELAPLEAFKDQLAIVQGISGKMCKGGHSSWFGAMGVYKTGGEHNSGVILRATADALLARLFPSPFNHVGLALRGKVMGKETEGTLYPGITASGPGRETAIPGQPRHRLPATVRQRDRGQRHGQEALPTPFGASGLHGQRHSQAQQDAARHRTRKNEPLPARL